jgi:outer membrane protein assembly factor BamB
MLAVGIVAGSCVAQDAANWPQFRGPNSLGVAVDQEVPAKFSGKENVALLWKSPVKMGGVSAPVVWGDKIFVTGGDAEKRQLYCYGADGKLLWTQDIKWNKPKAKKPKGDEEAAEEPELKEYVACNSPATDGKRVYAAYGTGDVVAYDFTGKKVWAISLWPIESQYGFCSSPILYKDKLIIQLDHSRESALISLDTATGKEAWRTKRNASDSFQSPILAETKAGAQIITATAGANNAYDPETGKELWSTSAGGSDDSPSPAYGNGIAVIAHTGSETQAIAVDGKGDVSKTHIKWKAEGAPEVASPVVKGNLAFVALEDKIVCYDLATGKSQWEQAIDEKAYASLVAVGDKVIFISQGGNILVFKAANKYEEVSKAELGEGTDSTPAIAGGRIYIRGSSNLFCFGAK